MNNRRCEKCGGYIGTYIGTEPEPRFCDCAIQDYKTDLTEKIERKIKEPEENQTQYSFGKDVGKIQAYKDIINLIREG